jgi:putative acetyltransferase
MNYKIDTVKASEYPEVVDVWEASVRATHHFLKVERCLSAISYHLNII